MTRNICTNVACFLLLSIAPVAAQVSPVAVVRRVPAPEADAGILALLLVGGVAILTYWRQRRS